MELIQTIALLCQISTGSDHTSTAILDKINDYQVKCQQSYLNCVLKKNTMSKSDALQKCILEK